MAGWFPSALSLWVCCVLIALPWLPLPPSHPISIGESVTYVFSQLVTHVPGCTSGLRRGCAPSVYPFERASSSSMESRRALSHLCFCSILTTSSVGWYLFPN